MTSIYRNIWYIFKWLLLPITLIYSIIVTYIKYKTKNRHAPFVTVNIGNLSTGGTGKTPHTEWLCKKLQTKLNLVLLSRGYGRTNNDVFDISSEMPAKQTGDEPLQFKKKFPNIPVWVSKKRLEAIPLIQKKTPDTDCIILDDAFQHWALATDLKILLSTYQKPFYQDHVLPMGNLREPRSGYKRADIIIITKCPTDISDSEQHTIKERCKLLSHQQLFFSTYKYGLPYHWLNQTEQNIESRPTLLLAALANPKPLKDHLLSKTNDVDTLYYRDHHPFSDNDIQNIIKTYKSLPPNTLLISTEKDATRLLPYQAQFEAANIDIWIIPIEVEILNNQESNLLAIIEQKIITFNTNGRNRLEVS